MTKEATATTIGLDIAKQVLQIHRADKSGRTVVRRKLRRTKWPVSSRSNRHAWWGSRAAAAHTTGRGYSMAWDIRFG
jgi:hypothetical protein